MKFLPSNDPFSSMVRQLTAVALDTPVTVDAIQYQEFMRQYIVDALAGKRLGQSFCDYFGISNASPLYYFRDNNFCERWIKDNYLVNEE